MSADFWLLVLFAFFFGVLIGWVLQRRTSPPAQKPDSGDAQSKKLRALEAEIETAKRLIETSDADTAFVKEALKGFGVALKRADDRLKLIMKAVKSARRED